MSELNSHIACVDVLTNYGVEAPKAWTELRAQYSRFLALEHENTEALAAAIISGDSASVPVLYGAALAEWFPATVADVRAVVATRVGAELQQIYAPHVTGAYRRVSDEFNDAAKAFTKLANTCDPELDPLEVTRADQKARQAWLDAPQTAERLDTLVPVLAAAAVLRGADPALLALTPESEPLRLALVVDDRGLHRRRIWEAWEASGRTGKWGALAALGVHLRAHPQPASLHEYRRPQPMGVQFKPSTELGGGAISVPFDPEDHPQETQPDHEWSVA